MHLLSSRVDAELLRVIAHAVLRNLSGLAGEGLSRDGIEQATAHALALTSELLDLDDKPARQSMHARGLWEVLVVLTGPVSATLMHWLDQAMGPQP